MARMACVEKRRGRGPWGASLVALLSLLPSCAGSQTPAPSSQGAESSRGFTEEKPAKTALKTALNPPAPPAEAVDPRSAEPQRLDCQAAADELGQSLVAQMEEELDRAFEEYRGSAKDCLTRYGSRDTRRQRMQLRSSQHPGPVSSPDSESSQTNLIVEGVDEADRVKHDGAYLYVLLQDEFAVFSIDPKGTSPTIGYRTDDYLKLLSVTPVRKGAQKFFLAGDRVVLLGSVQASKVDPCRTTHTCPFEGDGGETDITVLDVRDRLSPKEVRHARISGSLLAARRLDSAVHLVLINDFRPAFDTLPADLPGCFVPENEPYARAKFERRKAENRKLIEDALKPPTWTENNEKFPLCSDSLRPPGQALNSVTTIVSFDVAEKAGEAPRAVSLVSEPGAVHMSKERILLAVSRSSRYSDLHTFHISDKADKTAYEASGALEGEVTNDFSLDTEQDSLRVVTERRRGSALSILARSEAGPWATVGEVSGIARGEQLRAVRFVGDRAYLVTFLKTDPLYVIDLSDPAAPLLQGELKVPGFSTYLHPMPQEHLLSVGFDASRGKTKSVMLQIFDASDPVTPRLRHRTYLGESGSTSDAAVDHQAFTYLPGEGLLVLPVDLCFGETSGFHGLEVFRISKEKGFVRLGRLSHHAPRSPSSRKCDASFGRGPSSLMRSVVTEGLITSIHTDSVKAQHLDRLAFDPVVLEIRPPARSKSPAP